MSQEESEARGGARMCPGQEPGVRWVGGAWVGRARTWEQGDLSGKAGRGWSTREAEGRGEVEVALRRLRGGAKAKFRGGANSE